MFRNTGYVLLDERRVHSKITRIFLLEDAFAEADPALAESLRTLLEFMADDLPVVEHAKLAPEGFDPWREAMRVVQGYEVWQSFGDFVRRHNPKCGPGVRERMEFAAIGHAGAVRSGERGAKESPGPRLWRGHAGHVLVLPTSPSIAPRIDSTEAEFDAFRTRVMRLTCTASLTGLPQMSIPAALVNGCPAGLSFIGWAGGDEALLDLAFVLSRHLGIAV